MKKIILITLFSLGLVTLNAQVQNPVTWKYEAKKIGPVYNVIITATVDKHWHIYSQNTGKNGPVPTTITFKTNPLVTLVGKVKEAGKLEKIYDKNFQTDVLFYSNKVVFTQAVKVKAGIKTNISGTVEYMVCDDEKCLPPTKKTFDIKLY
jgi:thiol:disulfide interchange protein DsbD